MCLLASARPGNASEASHLGQPRERGALRLAGDAEAGWEFGSGYGTIHGVVGAILGAVVCSTLVGTVAIKLFGYKP
jgi:hypothetical protein